MRARSISTALGFCELMLWRNPPGPERERIRGIIEQFTDEFYAAAEAEGLNDREIARLLARADLAFLRTKSAFEERN